MSPRDPNFHPRKKHAKEEKRKIRAKCSSFMCTTKLHGSDNVASSCDTIAIHSFSEGVKNEKRSDETSRWKREVIFSTHYLVIHIKKLIFTPAAHDVTTKVNLRSPGIHFLPLFDIVSASVRLFSPFSLVIRFCTCTERRKKFPKNQVRDVRAETNFQFTF